MKQARLQYVGLLSLSLLCLTVPSALTAELQLDYSEHQAQPSSAFQGRAEKLQVQTASPQQPFVLQGKVQTLQDAIISEKDIVDWYAWYLSVRQYMTTTGSITDCPRGTPIKFYKNGRIEALSTDVQCKLSMNWRRFPLPADTKLSAVILPVRAGTLPPASPQEIEMRVRSSQ